MSLSLAFNSARSSLQATSTLIEVSARNIGGAGDPTYSRKIGSTTTTTVGSAYVVQIARASDQALYSRMIAATSNTASRQALLAGYEQLQSAAGTPDSKTSLTARIGALTDALTHYRNAPDEASLGSSAVLAARDLASSLNTAADAVLNVRKEADAAISDSVSRVNDLLKQFEVENNAVIKGTQMGTDITDSLDRRDAILSKLSEEMGISAVVRPNNDIVIYTDGGATLFETTPRTVTFNNTNVYQPGTTGAQVFVDGIPITSATNPSTDPATVTNATMPLKSGRIAGLVELRDSAALTFQKQLDELASELVDAFSEGPTDPGLFQATAGTGAAKSLAVNAAFDPAQGGSVDKLRDGNVVDYNTGDEASFSGRLDDILKNLAKPDRTFSSTGQIRTSGSIAEYGTASISWLASQRLATSTSADTEAAILSNASKALSNATGVNMDDEYAHQLDLEHSYQASSKLIGIINQLFDTLLNIR